MKERQVEQWKDLKNMEKSKMNSENTWKTLKKGKLNSDNIQKYERNVG